MLGKLALITFVSLLVTCMAGAMNPVINYSTIFSWKVVNRILVYLAVSEVGVLVILALIAIWRY